MKTPLVLLTAAVLALTGCATSKSGEVYTREQARREQTVRMGVVESVREVLLEGTKTPAGTLAGGAIGGIAGSTIGQGKGAAVAAIVGAVAGAIAGNAIEDNATRKQAMELTIMLDGGRMIAVVQEGDPHLFRPGDRVRVISGSETRVTH